MSRDNYIASILQDLDELKDLLEVIRQTPSAPEVLYKLAGEKGLSLSQAVQALPRETDGPAGEDISRSAAPDREVTPGSDSRSAEEDSSFDDLLDDEVEIPFEIESISPVQELPAGSAPAESSDRTQQNASPVVLYPEAAGSEISAVDTELSVEEVMQRKKAQDIRKAMTLNDRFRFLRELFMNSDDAMNGAIDALEKISTFADARIYLQEQFDWDSESEAVLDFMSLVEKHYL